MSILSAILQGILQGLTEFLPVSSSGHLSLYQYFTGINSESSVTFSVMLHLGTLLAVIIAFWPTVWQLLKEFFLLFADLFRGRLFKQPATPYRRMLYLLILSCVPLLLVLPLQDLITSVSADNDILVEGICFLITSALLFLADRAPRGHRDASTMKGKHALAIGVAQLFATLPGISRSGSTISVGQLCGLERSYAVSYSFILVLLDGDQLRDDMLVLGGLVLRGQDIVPLDLANNGQAMDLMPAALGGHAAGVIDRLAAALLLICFRLVLLLIFGGSGCFFLRHGFGSSLWVLPIV